ncbi:hypothetical protein QMQ05_14560 [Glutamicibacter ectropisis]|uniref:Uncharacterized protein n=1 Tax=Glutamicibacter ectropisis TaxID=3046593 RepID=A0AAU6WCH9_9MICC
MMHPRKRWAVPLALLVSFSIPASALAAVPHGSSANIAQSPGDGTSDTDYAAYVFPYFTGESTDDGEKIHLAVSKGSDPNSWYTLNDGKPILESELGTKGLRDPFLIRSEDGSKYYLLATRPQNVWWWYLR